MAAIWVGCAPGNFRQGRPGSFRPEAIVIHIMDGSMRAADSWFNDPRSQVSAHYGVGAGGEVHQYVKETDTAFHAGTIVRPSWPLLKPGVNPNYYTIGIEHEGRGDIPWPWPAAQLEASAALVRTSHRAGTYASMPATSSSTTRSGRTRPAPGSISTRTITCGA
jgi:N-acetyl-anhydromuramyl-L-alanine amidase AmpD